MNNLIIIGNGFDLAHGLKTSYNDFITYLIRTKQENKELYTDLFQFTSEESSPRGTHYLKIYEENIITKNSFFYQLLSKMRVNNWCDIEKVYYDILTRKDPENINRLYPDVKKLNTEFEIIKKYLSKYLKDQESNLTKRDLYGGLFNILDSVNTLILNFNYTDTLNFLYNSKLQKSNILHIHGNLHLKKNPIIFGYAANTEESRVLLNEEENEFLKNIKKYSYQRTANEPQLKNYLDSTENIHVSILGHSCGISDKHILNQIFNHKNIKSIRPFYYKGYNSYYNLQINIDRIMDNELNFEKLVNFPYCYSMLQYNDSDQDIAALGNEIKKLKVSIDEQERDSFVF